MKFRWCLILALTWRVHAATPHWITPLGGGAHDGSSLANAWSPTDYASGGGVISGDDTVHLNLGIGGVSPFASGFSLAFGGTSGHPVIYLFDAGCFFSAPNWNPSHGTTPVTAAYAALAVTAQYITLDGGTNGLITATSNGTGLATGLLEEGVYVSASNVTIQNLTITKMYLRTIGSDYFTGMRSIAGIYVINGSNILVNNCTISDSYDCVAMTFNNSSTYEIKGCMLTNAAVPISVGPANTNETMSGVLLHNNFISIGTNWEGSPSIHRDCVHLFSTNTSTGTLTGGKIYDNIFTGDLQNNASDYVLVEGLVNTCLIYNNLFLQPGPLAQGDGLLYCKGLGDNGTEILFNDFVTYNFNSVILAPVTYGATTLNGQVTIENNIFEGSGAGSYIAIYDTDPSTTQVGTSDYNWFYGASGNTPKFRYKNASAITLGGGAGWASLGFDAHSNQSSTATNVAPGLGLSYVPNAGAPVIGYATPLTSTVPLDAAGNTRPTGTPPNGPAIGAFEHGGIMPTPTPTPTPTSPPNPPSPSASGLTLLPVPPGW